MKRMKFLLMGLLSLCLLFVGCSGVGDSGSSNVGVLPPASESTENGDSSNGGSSEDDSSNSGSSDDSSSNGDSSEEDSSENNQNKNPYAGGLQNGGEFEGN